MSQASPDILRGTLDLLILKALSWGPAHGYAVARWIEQATNDALAVGEGTLYPALHRLEERGWIAATWGASENNRQAKFYALTRKGRTQLRAEDRELAPLCGGGVRGAGRAGAGIAAMRMRDGRRFRKLFGLEPKSDVEAELAFHVEMRIRELIEQGETPERARRLALRAVRRLRQARGRPASPSTNDGERRMDRDGIPHGAAAGHRLRVADDAAHARRSPPRRC